MHQLMHKGKRERRSKVDAQAGHYFVCFILHKLQVDLVRNCGCSSRKEGKQSGEGGWQNLPQNASNFQKKKNIE